MADLDSSIVHLIQSLHLVTVIVILAPYKRVGDDVSAHERD